MPTILLTRPRAASEQLAGELKRRGYACVIEPLFTIIPTASPPPDLTAIKAVMITSSNALEALDRNACQKLLALPCFCVGSQTADKAREFGFHDVRDAAGDGAALAQLIKQKTQTAQPILHIAGRDVDSAAGDELRRMGFSVALWAVYAAEAVKELSQPVIQQLQQRKLDGVMVFSTRTAETVKALLIRHALEACCASLIAIGISESAVIPLKPLPWHALAAAAMPTEDAVIERLQELLPVA